MPKPGARAVVLLIIALIALLVGLFMLSETGYSRLSALNVRITGVQERQTLLAQLLRAVSEAETSQRGLLLTQDEKYLGPYDTARQRAYRTLQLLEEQYAERRNASATAAVADLRRSLNDRFSEIERTLGTYRSSGAAQAIRTLREGEDFATMSRIRAGVRRLEGQESDALVDALASWLRDLETMRVAMAGATALNVLLVVVAGYLVVRHLRRRTRENVRLQREVNERTRELVALSSHLQDLSEREKKTLSRDLHDALGGLLVATKMDVAWLRNRLRNGDPQLDARWERIQRSLDHVVDFKRRIVEQLRPTLLDNMGLFAALRWQFQETCSRVGVQGREQIPEEELLLAGDAAIAIFRVGQEALTNVLKHARATSILLRVEARDGHLHMVIADNGRGIATSEEAMARGHGLASMRHRIVALGGTWSARRGEAGGTEIHVAVPLAGILARTSESEVATAAASGGGSAASR